VIHPLSQVRSDTAMQMLDSTWMVCGGIQGVGEMVSSFRSSLSGCDFLLRTQS
jgi:hypothetical protein